MITVGILALLTFAIVGSWIMARRRRNSARPKRDDIPLFTIPVSDLVVPIGRPPMNRGPTANTPSRFDAYVRPSSRPIVDEPVPSGPTRPPTIRTRDGAVSTIARPPRPDPAQEHLVSLDDDGAAGAAGEAIEGASVRYWRVADGTLQFLPGRLAISAGRDAGHEIRFVRTGGPDGTSITFGRAQGAPYRHVQLREPTVSRSHARMSLESSSSANGAPTSAGSGARWRLENLSSTNPVMVNGRPLAAEGSPLSSVILSDGDRIEMGEVAFVFHAR